MFLKQVVFNDSNAMKVITIGRHIDNDVVIDDVWASRYHLQIIRHDDGHYSLADFGSANGTFINGQKISGEVDLYENDVVRIGNTTIPWRLYFEERVQEATQINDNLPRFGDSADSSPNPTMSLKKECQSKKSEGNNENLKVIIVGRNESNDVVVCDPSVAQFHIRLVQKDDNSVWLTVLDRDNNTYVNGHKVSGDVNLHTNDVLRIGNTTIPWNDYFSFDSKEGERDNGNNTTTTPFLIPDEAKDSGYEDGSSILGTVIGIIISVIMIIGGLTGTLALRGTGSSTALVVVGVIFLLIEVLKIAMVNKNKN